LRNPQTSLLQARSDRNHVPMRTYPRVASLADRVRRTLHLRPDGMNQSLPDQGSHLTPAD
jgi:hypothetical protein